MVEKGIKFAEKNPEIVKTLVDNSDRISKNTDDIEMVKPEAAPKKACCTII